MRSKRHSVSLRNAFLFAVFIICVFAFDSVYAETGGVCGSATDWKLDDSGTLTIYGNGETFDFSKGNAPWYKQRNEITNVVIEEGVTVLGDHSIEGFTNLTSITVPDSLYGLGFYAIESCPKLTELTIPGDIRQWGTPMIYDCEKLHVYLTKEADSLLRTLREYSIPYTVTDADSDFIYADEHSISAYLGSEEEIIIPAGVTRIYTEAFAYDRNIKRVILPDTLTSIENEAFLGCSSLVSVYLPDSLTQIESGAFCDCTSLESITIPSSLNTIAGQLFAGCTELREIHLPTTFVNIENGAFDGCGKLQTVFYGGTEERKNTIIIDNEYGYNQHIIDAEWICEGNESSIMLCGNNVSWILSEDGVLSLSGNGEVFEFPHEGAPWYNMRSMIKSVVIGEGITYLGDYSIEDFDNLLSITIPESLSGLGFYAICNCPKLKEITFPSFITRWGTPMIFNCSQLHVNLSTKARPLLRTLREYNIPYTVFDADSDFIYADDHSISAYLGTDKEVTIPDGITRIYSSAFAFDRNVESIILPDSVTSIEHEAFLGCSSLKNISLSKKLVQIESSAFSECVSLYTISIPSSMRSINPYAFSACTGLKTVYLASNFANVSYGAFDDCSSITDVFFEGTDQQRQLITINNEDESNQYLINANWHCNYKGASNILVLPHELQIIGPQAFVNTDADCIKIPESVFQIADDAFPQNVILMVPQSSYAKQWAEDHEFAYDLY